jgi:hypothetical protein
MRVTRNPSDHSANFGRGAHTNYLPTNLGSVVTIKSMSLSLRSLYGDYFDHKPVDIFVGLKNYTRRK